MSSTMSAESLPIRVTVVRGLAGPRLKLKLSRPDWTVLRLKRRIAKHWRLPCSCQQLVLGACILQDDEQLTSHHPRDGEVLSLQVVVSLDAVLLNLVETNPEEVRIEALRTLAELGPNCGESAVEAVIECVVDESRAVRSAAWHTLHQSTQKGNELIIARFITFLDHYCAFIRQAGAKGLGIVADKGNRRAISALTSRLTEHNFGVHEPDDYFVRSEAVKALANIADVGDSDAIGVVSDLLADEDLEVRESAVEALAALTEIDDTNMIEHIHGLFEHPDYEIRCTAAKAVFRVVSRGNCRAVEIVSALLGDDDADVRAEAVTVLERIAHKGNTNAISFVTPYLEHADDYNRSSAVVALAGMVEVGDAWAIKQFNDCSHDPAPRVRCAALDGLAKVLNTDDTVSMDRIVALCDDGDSQVERAAWNALSGLLPKCDERVKAAKFKQMRRKIFV